jgi:nucleoside-diphosphate-sugar epimerase
VLNGSTAAGKSVVELANTICDLAGNRLEPIYDDVAEGEVSELAGGRMRLPAELHAMRMSYELARKTVGWEPQTSLREGLEREWKWLQDHPYRWTDMSY